MIKVGATKMKKIMKFLPILLLFFFTSINVKALSVSQTDVKIHKGESINIDVYENIDETINTIDFNLIFTTYDITGDFIPDKKFKDNMLSGTKHSLSFDDDLYGKVKIGTVEIKASSNPKTFNGVIRIDDVPINVTIIDSDTSVLPSAEQEEPEIDDYNLLQKIDSKITNITLKENIFEYTVEINQDVMELDLVPIPKDDSFDVNISSQKIEDLKDNKIIITVSKETLTQEYIINVKIKQDNPVVETNSNASENFLNTYKNIIISTIIFLSLILVIGIIFYMKKN